MLNMSIQNMEPESIAMEMQNRVKNMDSKEMVDIAEIFANCKNDYFEADELCRLFNQSREQINNTIGNLRRFHGLDIVNLSPKCKGGRYKMIGFNTPKKKKRRKVEIKYTKEMMRQKLLAQVFC